LGIVGGREKLPAATAKEIPRAIENAMTVGFDEFSGQVRAYLPADYQEYYGSRKVWEALQQEIVDVNLSPRVKCHLSRRIAPSLTQLVCPRFNYGDDLGNTPSRPDVFRLLVGT
jgi:hypothetical protein